MTNQNPSMSSPSPQDRHRQRDILAKVNAHADRSMDRLFADIEELLGDDLPATSAERVAQSTPAHTERYPQAQQPQSTTYPSQRAIAASSYTDADSHLPATAKPKKRVPFWLKAMLGVGITSIAAGGVGLWLVKEQKVVLPQIDTSWLPFQSRVAPADAKFADYMRKSLAKIEAAPLTTTTPTNTPTTTPVATPFNPTTSIIPPATTPAAIAPTIVTGSAATPAATPTANKIALVKTIQTGKHPEAIFQIDGHSQSVRVGQKIGTSNWSLLTVAKGEVILKRKGGEIRSIYVGQKF
jgi:Tfp pilus assembly protein PilP